MKLLQNKTIKYSSILTGIALLVCILATAVLSSVFYDSGLIIFGIAGVLAAAVYIITGIFLAIQNKKREWARAFLFSAGIIFLIGFSACSFRM